MDNPSDTPTPPAAATLRVARPTCRPPPIGARGPHTPAGVRRACPRCASPRRSRRGCSPSAWPSARRSALRPTPRSPASPSRCCCRRSPLSPGRRAGAHRAPPSRRLRHARQPHPPPRPRAPAERARRRRSRPRRKRRSSAASSPTTTPNAAKTPTTTGGEGDERTSLPPVTHVWLITLTGATFTQALAQPAAAPYIDSQLVPAGTLLSEWSSLDGSSFASEAGLLSGEPPQTMDSIVQPPCPEGAAGAACKPETAGALSAADEFLKADRAHDHLDRGLPRTRPDRDHVRRRRQRHRVEPAGGRLDRDAQQRAPGGRSADLAVRARRRAARRTTPTTRLPPSRAWPGCCTDAMTPQPIPTTKETHVARTTSRPPQSHVVARRARGLLSPCCSPLRRSSRAEESNPNNYSCLGSIGAGKPEVGSEEQQVAYSLLLQRPDHRLPAAVADSRDRRRGLAAGERTSRRALR